jgi:cysteine sulfinate desulfinase/cysteine desulfurase-like protein
MVSDPGTGAIVSSRAPSVLQDQFMVPHAMSCRAEHVNGGELVLMAGAGKSICCSAKSHCASAGHEMKRHAEINADNQH